MSPSPASTSLPLAGLRVIELGQLIAGPFATKLLGEFGAEVIKVEPPGVGDPLRKWRKLDANGTSLWWHVQSRNKKSITLDLKAEEGREILLELLKQADVLVENFRPGTLERWGLGWEQLHAYNPRLVMVRVSGYGQSGPYRDRPGFGVIGEAMGGLRYLTGQPGEPPVRVGISLGDSLAALYAVIGTLMALRERDQHSGEGQCIDVALYESVFGLMESLIPEYDAQGYIREPSGSALPGITPSNSYPCQDGFVLIAGNGDSIFKRLMKAIGRDDLADDPELAHNDGRNRHAERIDAAIAEWTRTRSRDTVVTLLNEASVPVGTPYTAADIVKDPHYLAREMIQTITTPTGSKLKVPGVLPKLSRTPGRLEGGGPTLGQHTDEVLESLGIDADRRQILRDRGIV